MLQVTAAAWFGFRTGSDFHLPADRPTILGDNMLHVYQSGAFVASINRQHKAADTYRASLPWLLLHNTGKTRACETHQAARDEAQKVYPGCTFSRNTLGGIL